MNFHLSIIVAMDKNRLIGGGNQMLWNIPGELKRFREITTGHPIIMGRKTFESIGRVLPNRTNIIITRDPEYKVEGATVVNSLSEAIKEAQSRSHTTPSPLVGEGGGEGGQELNEIFIIGGGQIYQQALPLADRLYLTIIEGEYQGDTYFPDYSIFSKILSQQNFDEAGIKYTTQILEKT